MLNLNILPNPSVVITVRHQASSKTSIWRPSYMESILYYSEISGAWRKGYFVGGWNDLRKPRSLQDEKAEKKGVYFEASPIHDERDSYGNLVYRSLVWDAELKYDSSNEARGGNNRREWVSNLDIYEYGKGLEEFLKQQMAAERLTAFDAVEAVA